MQASYSFQTGCLRQLSTIRDGELSTHAYVDWLSDLSSDIASGTTFKALPRRFVSVFHLLACADGRPCRMQDNPSIPTARSEDNQRTCETMQSIIPEADFAPLAVEDADVRLNETQCEDPYLLHSTDFDLVLESGVRLNQTICEERQGIFPDPWLS